MMHRLLVTGGSGVLGCHVVRRAQQHGWNVFGTFFTAPPPVAGQWRPLDVTNPHAIMALVREIQPDAIVHTAFLQHGASMWATTAEGAASVAMAAQDVGARLIHMSSDAIFDGTSNPYLEAATPQPVTPYGAAKAAAETAVAAIAPQAIIVRTSLILSREPLDATTRFILDLTNGQRQGGLFVDQYRCPIGVDDLAEAIIELSASDYAGVINIAGTVAVSRYTLGGLVARAHALDESRLISASVADYPKPIVADVRLDSTLAYSLLKTRVRGIDEWLGVTS